MRSVLFTIFVIAVLVPCSLAQHQTREQVIPRQGAVLVRPRADQVIPKQQEPERVLILPKASPQFSGDWGGHIYLLAAVGAAEASQATPTSLTFGQRSDGTVFLRTGLWGSSGSRVVRTSAAVTTPQRIKIHEEHFHQSETRMLRVIQDFDIILKPPNDMDCLETIKAYPESGEGLVRDERPLFTANYRGILHSINDSQAQALQEEIIKMGDLPQAEIRGEGQF